MKNLFLFIICIYFSNLANAAQFGLSYFPDKVAINFPEKKMETDKEATFIIENKLMTNLVVQILENQTVVGNRIILANQTNNIIIKHDKKNKYFVRTIQPALELIELKFIGRKIEIP